MKRKIKLINKYSGEVQRYLEVESDREIIQALWDLEDDYGIPKEIIEIEDITKEVE